MKPSSLATLFIRLFAIYLLLAGIFGAIGQMLLSAVFSTVIAGSGAQAMGGPFAGFFGLQLITGGVCIFFSLVLYANSRPLGQVIAKGLD